MGNTRPRGIINKPECGKSNVVDRLLITGASGVSGQSKPSTNTRIWWAKTALPIPTIGEALCAQTANGPARADLAFGMPTPGEELQLDFDLGAPIDDGQDKKRRSWVLRMVLSYSRKA
jgi:hypothetical protein